MSGNEKRFVDYRDQVLEDFEHHVIVRCHYKVDKDDDEYVDGYSIILKSDAVVQARVPSFAAAVQNVMQAEQVLQMLAAFREHESSQASTEGLLSDAPAGDEDVIN